MKKKNNNMLEDISKYFKESQEKNPTYERNYSRLEN